MISCNGILEASGHKSLSGSGLTEIPESDKVFRAADCVTTFSRAWAYKLPNCTLSMVAPTLSAVLLTQRRYVDVKGPKIEALSGCSTCVAWRGSRNAMMRCDQTTSQMTGLCVIGGHR